LAPFVRSVSGRARYAPCRQTAGGLLTADGNLLSYESAEATSLVESGSRRKPGGRCRGASVPLARCRRPTRAARPARARPAAPPGSRARAVVLGRSDGEAILAAHTSTAEPRPHEGSRGAALPGLGLAIGRGASSVFRTFSNCVGRKLRDRSRHRDRAGLRSTTASASRAGPGVARPR
jgi:hypothetical protein